MINSNIYLSLVVPFYNEEENITTRYKNLTKFLKSQKFSYKLIFVNDGSKDRSKEEILKAIKNDPNANLISYSKNKGRGGAIVTGFKKTKGTYIGYIDSDLEIRPDYIGKCLQRIKNYDGVVVSKHLPDSKVKTTFLRRSASKFFNYWTRLILRSKVTDHQAGLKIFKCQVINKVLPKIKENGWLFDVEFIYYAQNKGFTIGEVPVKAEYGIGKLRKSMISGFLNSLLFVVKLRLNEKS